jgi:5-methylcytosine-specific restriction protein B
MTLKQYLENKNAISAFIASQSDIGGNITFSNSGKRGSVKQFTLGLDSFISILKDIKANIKAFQSCENYVEKDWRDLGSKYYTDGPANAMSTVQTKPLFSTLSKIISWANDPKLENIDMDQFLKISNDTLENAIAKMEDLSKEYKIQNNKEPKKEIPKEAQVIYSYLVKSMSHRKIQEYVLGIPAPDNGGGFLAMQILHDFDIRDDKKGILASTNIDDEIAKSSGKYLEALLFIKKYFFELSKLREDENIDFKKYFVKFSNSSYESIKTNYAFLFDEIFSIEKEWMCPIEKKLEYIKLEADRIAVSDVIEKLKNENYSFAESDVYKLSTFSRVIDKTINASNFINNFTVKNLQNNKLSIYDFFNKIKTSNTLKELKASIDLSGTLFTAIPYYYSAVKHCQNPIQFPIHYKYWYTCLNSIFDKEVDYDILTEYYRTFPEKDRHLNFCAFWGALGKAVLLEIRKDLIITHKESKAYKRLFKLIPSEKYIEEIFGLNSNSIALMEIFNYSSFYEACLSSNFFINKILCIRFIASLLTKPFVILTGLSGSGKTKLAQAFASWICEDKNQYCIVPVGADWTNREPLLGFPNALVEKDYKLDEYGVLKLIIEANNNLEKPYFLILDEMNLSHVERYFADFLSVMESKTKISLHSGNTEWNDVPTEIGFPKNLFIIGTVNIDETTYMFSPKVLDRANVLEFRVTESEMENYLLSSASLNLEYLEGLGATTAGSFVKIANDDRLEAENNDELNKTLIIFFSELKKTGAEFGYRSASEILRFSAVVNKLESTWTVFDIIDASIMQKLLPKVHGSRRKLEPVLKTLGTLCLHDGQKFDDLLTSKAEIDFLNISKVKYPVSLEKILRMYNNLISNGFTSYAEA